jgi:hypothetical protein
MNTRKLSIALVAFLMLSVVLVGTVYACPTSNCNQKPIQCPSLDYYSCLKLPTSSVTVTVGPAGVYPFQIVLSGVPSGYDVINNFAYNGWCADLLTTIQENTPLTAALSSSLCKLPPIYASTQWNMVNYILNNKQGTGEDVQAAIWLALGFTAAQIQTNAGSGFSYNSATANAMLCAAKAHSGCFDACFNKIVAVIVTVKGSQTTIIELKNPCSCNWACYWNQCGCNWGCNWNLAGCN